MSAHRHRQRSPAALCTAHLATAARGADRRRTDGSHAGRDDRERGPRLRASRHASSSRSPMSSRQLRVVGPRRGRRSSRWTAWFDRARATSPTGSSDRASRAMPTLARTDDRRIGSASPATLSRPRAIGRRPASAWSRMLRPLPGSPVEQEHVAGREHATETVDDPSLLRLDHRRPRRRSRTRSPGSGQSAQSNSRAVPRPRCRTAAAPGRASAGIHHALSPNSTAPPG